MKTSMTCLFARALAFANLAFSEQGIAAAAPPPTKSDEEEIQWLKPLGFEPNFIAQGQWKDQGIDDKLTAYINANLRDYTHKYLYVTSDRAVALMQDGGNYCNLGAIRTAKAAQFGYFTIPKMIFPAHLLFINKSALKTFEALNGGPITAPVSLETWLEKEPFLTVAGERSYGPRLDSIIEKNKANGKISAVAASESTQTLLTLLQTKRALAIIEYPHVMSFDLKNAKHSEGDYIGIQLKENVNFPFFTVISCSKNTWGKKLVAKLNTTIKSLRLKSAYYKIQEDWVMDKPAYSALYKKYFGTIEKL